MPGTLRFDPRRLVKLRTDAGLSREQVAVSLGRSYQSVTFWEKGISTPPTVMLGRLSDLLGAEPGEFFVSDEVAEAVR